MTDSLFVKFIFASLCFSVLSQGKEYCALNVFPHNKNKLKITKIENFNSVKNMFSQKIEFASKGILR